MRNYYPNTLTTNNVTSDVYTHIEVFEIQMNVNWELFPLMHFIKFERRNKWIVYSKVSSENWSNGNTMGINWKRRVLSKQLRQVSYQCPCECQSGACVPLSFVTYNYFFGLMFIFFVRLSKVKTTDKKTSTYQSTS